VLLQHLSKNIPRASTVNYVADGFTLYVVTSGKSTKVKNVKENPKVSVAIDDHGKTRLGLQAEGIAKSLAEQKRNKLKISILEKGIYRIISQNLLTLS
jgi:general stress protein 26